MATSLLFSAPMVRAVLDGRKTQTRRVLAIRGHRHFSEFGPSDTPGYDWHFRDAGMRWHDLRHDELLVRLPFAVGDLRWVREPWRTRRDFDHLAPRDIPVGSTIQYDATGPTFDEGLSGRSRPGMFLPRWASRLTIRVTGVKVERLQDISEEDAKAEGLEWRDGCWATYNGDGTMRCGGSLDPIEAYRCLWININGTGSWELNPWVVAVTFEVLRRDGA